MVVACAYPAILLPTARKGPQYYNSAFGSADYLFFEPVEHVENRPRILVPRALEVTPNYHTARAWLHNCQGHHGGECDNTLSALIEGLLLIDCNDSTVVQASTIAFVPWLALSYLWGDKDQDADMSSSTIFERSSMPRTVEDAMKLTRELGYRYLWVDEYCINQRNSAHKSLQIMQMNETYSGADLTIVAAAGDDKFYGLPGVGQTERHKSRVLTLEKGVVFSTDPEPRGDIIHGSKWATRGWTFQEGVLSKHILVFTKHQMSFC